MASDNNQDASSGSPTDPLAANRTSNSDKITMVDANFSELSRIVDGLEQRSLALEAEADAFHREHQHLQPEPGKKEPQAQVKQEDASTAANGETSRIEEKVGTPSIDFTPPR